MGHVSPAISFGPISLDSEPEGNSIIPMDRGRQAEVGDWSLMKILWRAIGYRWMWGQASEIEVGMEFALRIYILQCGLEIGVSLFFSQYQKSRSGIRLLYCTNRWYPHACDSIFEHTKLVRVKASTSKLRWVDLFLRGLCGEERWQLCIQC